MLRSEDPYFVKFSNSTFEEKYEYYAVLNNKKIIASTKIIKYGTTGVWEISDIFVKPNYRNKGIARSLVKYIEDLAKKQNVHKIISFSFVDNKASKFWLKLNYKIECLLKNNWFHKDTYRFCKFLKPIDKII